MDNANKHAKVLRAEGRAVDEPALESLKVQRKVWLSQKKKSSKAGETKKYQLCLTPSPSFVSFVIFVFMFLC